MTGGFPSGAASVCAIGLVYYVMASSESSDALRTRNGSQINNEGSSRFVWGGQQ
jgi:hypothetical protein